MDGVMRKDKIRNWSIRGVSEDCGNIKESNQEEINLVWLSDEEREYVVS